MKPLIGIALFVLALLLGGLFADERWGASPCIAYGAGLVLGGAVVAVGLPKGFWKRLWEGSVVGRK